MNCFNPFVPGTLVAWAIFLFLYATHQFKDWAWAVWAPWLIVATAAPVAWHFMVHKKPK